MPGHGVDGKIPPGKVLLHPADKADLIGAAVVAVFSVGPKGGHLPVFLFQADGKGAVAQAGGDDSPVPKGGGHLLRGGGGAKVPVVGRKPQQAVPDAAAHSPGLVSGGLQPFQNGGGRGRDGKSRHGQASFW